MLPLLFLLFGTAVADDISCATHFPLRESVEILKKLLAKYATPTRRVDDNGSEWISNLFVKNSRFEIDGVRYYLNDNSLPPESTFYFTDSLLLDSVPIFVVEEGDVKDWRPEYPDRTKALTKISHRCGFGQRTCGLKCCYGENDIVQKGFLDIASTGNLTASSTFTFNDVTYSLLTDNSSTSKCTYYLSYYDTLLRKATIRGKQTSAILFSCPASFTCCGLRCVPPPATALLRKTRETDLLSLQFDRGRLNTFLAAGSVISMVAFLCITFINQRRAMSHNESTPRGLRREMVDTQTSTFSLHDDIENLLTGANSAV